MHMINYVYKKRKKVDGKTVASKYYYGRYRLEGETKVTPVFLGTADKQVAKKLLSDIIVEKQKQKAGLAPSFGKDSLSKPIEEHIEDFATDMKERASGMHVYTMRKRLLKLAKECKWKHLSDATSDSFVSWRSAQTFAPSTRNQYLEYLCRFFKWLVSETKRFPNNPFQDLGKVDERKKARVRRAFNDEDLQRVLDVAGEWRVGYLAAVYTGLRRGELASLEWRHVHLDAASPYLTLEGEFTKNGEPASLPLHPDLVEQLDRVRPLEASPSEKIFSKRTLPTIYMLKRHLQKAGIPFKDESGRQLDFHSLRYTLATNLSLGNVAPRIAMEMMRHKDIHLTMNTYTDSSRLELHGAIKALPSFSLPAATSRKKGGGEVTQMEAQSPDSDGQELAQPVAGGSSGLPAHSPETEGFRRELTLLDIARHEEGLAALLGLEPRQTDPESAVLPLHHKARWDPLFRAGVEYLDGKEGWRNRKSLGMGRKCWRSGS